MAAKKPSASSKATRAYKHVRSVDVWLWDQKVGTVARDPKFNFYAFAYTPEFSALGIEPSPLKMPVQAGHVFLFTDLPEATYRRLPAMLSDALPDDFGNALIDRWMAERGIAQMQITALDRLAYMSTRAMGALQFKPARGPASRTATAIVLADLVQQARNAVRGIIDADDHAHAALRSIIDVGTSAGGARAKAVIAWNRDTNEIRAGQVVAPDGFEFWLLKFDDMGPDRELGPSQDYGRIEYAYHLMAKAAGIEMMESRLLEENGRAHFMTKRFDREQSGQRHHIQTLCAMAHLDYRKKGTNSYTQLFATMKELSLPYQAMEEGFRRMVFNVMGRNCDDHTKNFAFRLRQHGPWELAPAYDVTFAHNPLGEWTNQHLMSANGKFADFSEDDLLAEASRYGVGTARRVIAEVRASIENWRIFAKRAGLAEDATTVIGKQLLLLD